MFIDCLNLLGIDLDPIIRCIAVAFVLIGGSAFCRTNRNSSLLPGGLSDNNAGIVHLNVVNWLIKLFLALSFMKLSGACITILGLDFTLKLWSLTLHV